MYDAGSATTTKVLDPECLAATVERIAVALERIVVALERAHPAPPPPAPPRPPTAPDGWIVRVIGLPNGRECQVYHTPDGRQYTEVRRTEAGGWQARNGDRPWVDV